MPPRWREAPRVTMSRIALLAFAPLCALAACAAWAQDWKPDKNIEIVVGLSAGSSQDRTGRTLQKIWQDTNLPGVTSTVVNRVGGSGQVAWNYLSQHPADPHYVQIATPTVLTGAITGASRFVYTDFTPLALLGHQYIALATQSDSALRSGLDVIERLKRDPTSVSLGINSAGSALHILAATLVKTAGGDPKKAKIAVFQGAELLTAAIGGHIDCVVTVAANIAPHMQSGKLRMLGIAAPHRLGGMLAAVPTWKEQGVDTVVPNWTGVFGVGRMNAQQIAWWDRVLAASVASNDWKSFLEANLWDGEYLASADFARLVKSENVRFRGALTELGLAKQ